MADDPSSANALLALYALSAPPTPAEAGVLDAQLVRLKAMMATPFAPSGALFEREPTAFGPLLDQLADPQP